MKRALKDTGNDPRERSRTLGSFCYEFRLKTHWQLQVARLWLEVRGEQLIEHWLFVTAGNRRARKQRAQSNPAVVQKKYPAYKVGLSLSSVRCLSFSNHPKFTSNLFPFDDESRSSVFVPRNPRARSRRYVTTRQSTVEGGELHPTTVYCA